MATSASAAQQSQLVEIDPILKFKHLLPRLKESLANLMKVAAHVFNHNSQVDACVKSGSDSLQQRLDKSLEEFYAICDQIELNLRLALECHTLSADSAKYTPFSVQGNKVDPTTQTLNPNQDSQSVTYASYLSTIKTQITCAKEIHDTLMECARKITESPTAALRQAQTSAPAQQPGAGPMMGPGIS